MERHVSGNVRICVLISAALAFGCDEGGEAEKLALSAVIPDPVTIELGLATGTMTFDFSSHPLDLERQYDLELFFFTGGIGVTVTNDETGVTYDLTEGSCVLTTPDDAGEYLVSVTPDGKTVTVRFFNWFEGYHIDVTGDYSAAVNVLENEFFVTEAFNRDVVVTE